MSAAPDEELWAAACRGDAEAFGQIFDRHADRVLTYCTRLLGGRQDADLVTSEVFVQAWKRGRRVTFVEGSLLPWLFAIGNNVARRHARSLQRYERLRGRALGGEPEPDTAEQVVEDLELTARGRMVHEALSQLSSPDREVIALCDLGELSYTDAAHVLQVPVGTVRSRLSRARGRLRDVLAAAGTRPSMLSVTPEKAS